MGITCMLNILDMLNLFSVFSSCVNAGCFFCWTWHLLIIIFFLSYEKRAVIVHTALWFKTHNFLLL